MANTGRRMQRLIAKGPKEKCQFSGIWDYNRNMTQDGKGGRIRKTWDVFVRHPENQKSKLRKGTKWQRGFY